MSLFWSFASPIYMVEKSSQGPSGFQRLWDVPGTLFHSDHCLAFSLRWSSHAYPWAPVIPLINILGKFTGFGANPTPLAGYSVSLGVRPLHSPAFVLLVSPHVLTSFSWLLASPIHMVEVSSQGSTGFLRSWGHPDISTLTTAWPLAFGGPYKGCFTLSLCFH